MQILNDRQIGQKIQRLAIEILENHFDETSLYLVGVNNNGTQFAKLLHDALQPQCRFPLHLTRVKLNPANPLSAPVQLDIPLSELSDQAVLLVDDVANTGRTLFYACRPFLDVLPKKIEIAVLVDRKHKSFPVKVDYMGLSLATTLMEHIDVHLDEPGNFRVFLR